MAWTWQKKILLTCFLGILLSSGGRASDDEEITITSEEVVEKEEEVEEVVYTTPKQIENAHVMETFDDSIAFEKNWVRSQAKKEGVDDDIAKYNGVWVLEGAEKMPLTGDRGLVLKSKAKHAAISVPLKKPFYFTDKPLVVQYEVNLQNGQDCGGSYIKLLSTKDDGTDLNNFNDKTPYTIMFGPDKCGNDFKLHFIFRHFNPLSGEVEEKHAKRPRDKFEEAFKDKKPHLYTLVVRPDNTYDISVDQEVINTGNLLEDFSPPVNPPKEISDPDDFMPKDWDEKEKIPDPEATKPEDWDEDAAVQIPDPAAVKPNGWLDEEPEMVADPTAEKPEDWDDEMDGEWEPALINNPVCAEAPGCGEWKAAMIDNPGYKGKWRPPMIDNPNYRGKWKPRNIPNPNYFEDLEPFKMRPIGAVGIELWSMSDNILFDNLIVTDSINDAYQLAAETFDLKIMKLEKGQTTLWAKILKLFNHKPVAWVLYLMYILVPCATLLYCLGKWAYKVGVFRRIINYSNKNPWLYGIYVLLVAIPVVLIIVCCCAESKDSKDAKKKKTDEPTEDDPHGEEEEATGEKAEEEPAGNEESTAAANEEASENVESLAAKDAEEKEEQIEEGGEEQEDEAKSDKEEAKSDKEDAKSDKEDAKSDKEEVK
ncbi:Calnexin [Chionoecetes opilio]|uniref:Calnexin n=1 Tax=Chionoecetes opilio TaxID=41210 RepID=A0A8J5CHP5_CHIOP|nr:Calnexin [Chionoecetes opilio]